MIDRPVALIKITQCKYADLMVKKGQIHFSKPIQWSNMGLSGDAVVGDPLEGCYAASQKDDMPPGLRCPFSESFSYNGLVRYRSHRVMNLAAYCLYAIYFSDFTQKDIDKIGDESSFTYVSNAFFKSFADGMPKDKWEKLPDDEKPVVAIIHNPNEFIKRLSLALSELLSAQEKLIFSRVKYIDASHPFLIANNPPNELLYKSAQ